MRVLQQLVPSRSNSSASRHPLLPRSGWRPLNDALADYPLASFSDNFTAPSGILWPFFLAFFSSSSTFLAPRSAASSFSYRINVPFSTTLAPPIRISSSTCSLRIAWEVRLGAVAQAVITMAASVWLTSSTEQSGRSGNNVKMDMDSFLERKFEMSRGEWFLSFYHIFLYER